MSSDIRLRRYQDDDVDRVAEAVLESHAALSKWMPWCHPEYGRQDAATWVASRREAWERNEEKCFLIISADERILGSCGLHRLNLPHGVGELGYWVRSSATGQGVATDATRLACQWAFEEGGLHRIEILAAVENLASQRVATKAGGVREGVLRERLLLHGRRHDCVLYSIVQSDLAIRNGPQAPVR